MAWCLIALNITQSNADLFSIGPLGTSKMLIVIQVLSNIHFKKMRLNVSPTKYWPFYLGLNVFKLPWVRWGGVSIDSIPEDFLREMIVA